MRNIKTIIYALAFGLTISSCSKDPCTSELLGVYTGTCSSDSDNYEGDITILSSSKGDFDLLLRDDLLNGGDELIEGLATDDCGKINIPLQNVTDGNSGYTVSGEFIINGATLTGQIELVSNGFGIKCNYNMTKR